MKTVRVVVEDEATGQRIALYGGIPATRARAVVGWLNTVVGMFATMGALRKQIDGLPRARTARGKRR